MPMFMTRTAGLVLLAAAGGAAAAEPACEFHVWSSQGISIVAQGAVTGGSPLLPSGTMSSVSGDYVGENNGISNYMQADPGEEDSPLSPKLQLELLARMQLAETFALEDYAVTLHDDAISGLALRRSSARLTDSTSPCYAELVLQDVTYSLEFGRDDKLKTLFFFRKFGPDGQIERRFSSLTQQKMEMNVRSKKLEKAAWEAEVQDAFSRNVIEFAAALNK